MSRAVYTRPLFKNVQGLTELRNRQKNESIEHGRTDQMAQQIKTDSHSVISIVT